jgi:hypothetical protein
MASTQDTVTLRLKLGDIGRWRVGSARSAVHGTPCLRRYPSAGGVQRHAVYEDDVHGAS